MKEIIKDRISSIIAKIEGDGTLIVLKGISPELLGINKPELNALFQNKFLYFSNILAHKQTVITYDEFIALLDFIVLQYSSIYILDNNLFLNYYPLAVTIDGNSTESLMKHYDQDYNDDSFEFTNLVELANIYGNFTKVNQNFYVVFNDLASHEKVKHINLWEDIDNNIVTSTAEFDLKDDVIEIIDELDYLEFVDDIFEGSISVVNVINNLNSSERYSIRERIITIRHWFKDYINISIGNFAEQKRSIEDYPEFIEILKKYWNKNEFLNITNYDVEELQYGKKKLNDVSQGEIISTIVNQVENSINNESFRDIFVTAPTGSGKSAMFQIPAIYIAEKYRSSHGLLTIVISPLIGLMKDQVKNLEIKEYRLARTINSDVSPIKKQEIIDDIAERRCDILYISPETLLSRSDVEQLIGDRQVGLFVIDEAHIVTTWGKQFRPDYWFLGEHIKKIRKAQMKKHNRSFPIATFTATAIYGGIEDMYFETKQSLHMLAPYTYLGYVKRPDINILIERSPKKTDKTEYELEKFDQLIDQIRRAIITNKKMLIYFPTVALINRFNDYCYAKGLSNVVVKYHGQMGKQEKEENYERFYNKERLVMIATKAFGMGIDIDDIEVVVHFAPTGNVCDYVQEIGRAARRMDLVGEAYYNFMSNDFKHINRLHGLSMIREYQLIEVIRKIHELFVQKIKQSNGARLTKKRNEMLIDAESFSHIFESTFSNEDDAINKVKTAMLIIQKDFENKQGFSPFHIRPIPLFSIGYFRIDEFTQRKITNRYGDILKVLDAEEKICSVNLNVIWEQEFNSKFSFPQFKYLVYSKSSELNFDIKDQLSPALVLDIYFENNYRDVFNKHIKGISDVLYTAVSEDKFYSINDLADRLMQVIKISEYSARTIMDIIVATITVYARDFSKSLQGRMYTFKEMNNSVIKYKFSNSIENYIKWVSRGFEFIQNNIKDGRLYLVDDSNDKKYKEYLMLLGILEMFGMLTFKATGGSNSQIYIYVNETKTMKQIIQKPYNYHNKLLELVGQRHKISVAMLTYMFEHCKDSNEIWDCIENYFLGIIPEQVKKIYKDKFGEELVI